MQRIKHNGPNGTSLNVFGSKVTVYPDIFNSFAILGPALRNGELTQTYKNFEKMGMEMTTILEESNGKTASFKAISTWDTFYHILLDKT